MIFFASYDTEMKKNIYEFAVIIIYIYIYIHITNDFIK